MRARNLKPGFFSNEQLAECDAFARILFQGLWCLADREGRLEDRPKRIKVAALPFDDVDVNALLEQLATQGLIHRYEVGGQKLIWLPRFSAHQRPHPNEADSQLPPYPGTTEVSSGDSPGDAEEAPRAEPLPTKVESTSNQGATDFALNPSSLNPSSLNEEVGARTKRFSKPSVEDVATYCRERGNSIDPERFVNYYAAIGWVVGRSPMRDWKACVRNWEKRTDGDANGRNQPRSGTRPPQSGVPTSEKVRAQRAARAEMEKYIQAPLTGQPWKEGQNGQ